MLLGDTMLGRLVNEKLKEVEPNYIWGDTLDTLHQADFRLMNLECVMSDVGHKWDETPKVFHFRSDLKNIQCLKNAKIDMLSCANNHVLDYSYEAMVEMLQTFDRIKYPYVGIGMNFSQAAAMKIANINNLKIGVISCTDNEPGWEATDEKMGARYIKIDPNDQRYQMLLQQIRQQRQLVDILILSIHWGGNWGVEPPAQHRQLGRDLIDAGADIVLGIYLDANPL